MSQIATSIFPANNNNMMENCFHITISHNTREKQSGLTDVFRSSEVLSWQPPDISHLQSSWTVRDHLGRVLQSPAGLVFSLGSDHFSSGLSGSLGLSSHGSLERLRDSDILHLHPLHCDAPGVRGLVKSGLNKTKIISQLGAPLSSQFTCMSCAMASLSERMSPRFLVPSTFLRVVAANNLAEAP